jgi:antitoxin VapB
MTLTIHHPEADRLAKQLAATTGESVTDAVLKALRERLEREKVTAGVDELLMKEAWAAALHCASLPEYDSRSADEILGYDEHGLPFR